MCLAIPGKVVRKDGRKLTISYPQSITREALEIDVPTSVGDVVMVQMGMVIKKLSNQEYLQVSSAWNEIDV